MVALASFIPYRVRGDLGRGLDTSGQVLRPIPTTLPYLAFGLNTTPAQLPPKVSLRTSRPLNVSGLRLPVPWRGH